MNLNLKNNHSTYGYSASVSIVGNTFVFHCQYPKWSLNKLPYHFECEIFVTDDIIKLTGDGDALDAFKSLYALNSLLAVNDLHLLPKNLLKSLRDLRQTFVHPQAKLF